MSEQDATVSNEDTGAEDGDVDIDEGASSRGVSAGDSDVESLSLGMETLDTKFQGGGIEAGTLLGVYADPLSMGDVFVGNLLAGRPTYYFSFTRSEGQLKAKLEELDTVGNFYVRYLDECTIEALFDGLEQMQSIQRMNIVVDPINLIENSDPDEYIGILQELEELVTETYSLGILYALNDETRPSGRSLTTQFCDMVLEVRHTSRERRIDESMLIQKFDPRHGLKQKDERVFQLQEDIDMDISSNENFSV